MNLPRLRLKKREDRRFRRGHRWGFSNEIDTRATPLKNLEPGDLVVVEDVAGKPLGIANVNPNALICARLLTRNFHQAIDSDFWRGGQSPDHPVHPAIPETEYFKAQFYRLNPCQ